MLKVIEIRNNQDKNNMTQDVQKREGYRYPYVGYQYQSTKSPESMTGIDIPKVGIDTQWIF